MAQSSSRTIKITTITLGVFVIIIAILSVSLPKLISYEVTALIHEYTDTDFSINNSEIDLFPLQITLHDIAAKDKKNNVLISANRLAVAVNLLSFFSDEKVVSSIELDKPYVLVELNKKGELGLLSHIKLKKEDPVDNKETQPLNVLFNNIQIVDGTIDVNSQLPNMALKRTLKIAQLKVDNFHTVRIDTNNSILLEAQESEQSTIKVKGKLDLSSQKFIGTIDIKALNITPFLSLAPLPLVANVGAIPTDVSTNINLDFSRKFNIKLNKGSLALHNIKLRKDVNSPNLIDIPMVKLSGIALNFQKQFVKVKMLAVDNSRYVLTVNKSGEVDWLDLWKPEEAIDKPAQKAVSQPWSINVDSFLINNNTITLQQLMGEESPPVVLNAIFLKANNIKFAELNKAFPLELNFQINQTGKVKTTANVAIKPLDMSGNINIEQFALTDLQTAVSSVALIQIIKGQLDSQLQFAMKDSDGFHVSVQGNSQIPNFKIRKKDSKKKLLSWDILDVKNIHFEYPKNQLTIDNIDITNSYGRIVIDETGISNIQDLIIPNTNSEPVVQANVADKENTQPLHWLIYKTNMKDADIGFTDQSMHPNFTTAIKSLNGSIKNLSSEKDQLATIDLHGKVNRYAPVNIIGDLSLNTEKPVLDLHMDFKNLELTSFTPYSGIYAGYSIDKGQMTMDVNYKLKEKRIKGKNHIVINQLKFGKPVSSDKIINLPIKFAIALLSDENGIIDLGFDVNGNIDDPKFSLNRIILKTLQETIKKMVTSPFKYLKNVFASKQKNIQSLDFMAGSEDLTDETLEKIKTVAQFLETKKMLQLNVQGNADAAIDKPALQESELLQILSVETKRDPLGFLPNAKPYNDKELLAIFAEYYTKQRGKPYKQLLQSVTDENKTDAVIDKESIDRITYEQAWAKIRSTTTVSNDDIDKLAERRAQHIKATLIDDFNISPDRIFVLDRQYKNSPSLTTRLYIDAK